MKNNFFQKNHSRAVLSCYDEKVLKTKIKDKIVFASILSIAAGVLAGGIVAGHVNATDFTCDSATPANGCNGNVTFQVNVVESLSVTVSADSSETSGAINTLLRRPVSVDVTSNNSAGFTASMYSTNDSKDSKITEQSNEHTVINTDLTNGTSGFISTLSANTSKEDFPANSWGYNLQYSTTDGSDASTGDTKAGNDSSVYSAMTDSTTSPITVMNRTKAASGSQVIWFGAKANAAKASGEYKNTVVLSVVSGVTNQDTNPVTPTNPATPETDTVANNDTATYTGSSSTVGGGTNGTTVGTVSSTSGDTETTTTTITNSDTTGSYSDPKGVVEDTVASINTGAPLATGLAVTAAVAATSGIFFFILAKRKKDDDEEEDEA